MSLLSVEHRLKAEALAAEIKAHLALNLVAESAASFDALGAYLKACETKLMKLMDGQKPPDSEPGNAEFGLVLYILDTDFFVLARLLRLPPTSITPEIIEQWRAELEGAGVVSSDGTLLGFVKYELDPGWVLALLYCIRLRVGAIKKAPFGGEPQCVQAGSGPVTVAVIGDWGTGQWADGASTGPALAVLAQVAKLQPDYTIHLGDVYYAGTEQAPFGLTGEEVDNFVNIWQAGTKGTFTLNSNHEMYDGANGYFGKALTADMFRPQHGTSYFALEGDSWLIVGLDSAYYSDIDGLFMNGAVVDQGQINFLKACAAIGKKIIVMTHHNPITTDGTAPLHLLQDVTDALGRAPDLWYWGHIHNAIVYSAQSAAGAMAGRCIGHGAIPFGSAYGLQNADGSNLDTISYFANTPMPAPDLQQQNRVLNGFALLTFTADSVTEQIYDQLGCIAWQQVTPLT
ncbi:MAG TPA: metallophosphoesterase [Pyrinomonadaceae bacterium]